LNAYAATPEAFPALVLNADFRPLSYYPLSLWSWQESVKAVFLERVNIVSEYDRFVRSPSFEMRLPSVVSLKTYVKPALYPAFTRFNVFLRDRFVCQYCGSKDDLTFDHLIPRSRGGQTRWDNVVTACAPCNLSKGGHLPHHTGRRCLNCIATAACFRPITCTKAGSTISTGIPSLSPKPALRCAVGRAGCGPSGDARWPAHRSLPAASAVAMPPRWCPQAPTILT
jgi:5-methylcytosine-specific restriction endonuclease McrA